MPITPEGVPDSSGGFDTPDVRVPLRSPGITDQPKPRRHARLLRVCFAIFAFEIGLFLVLFPWMDAWNANQLQDLSPAIQQVWDEPYLRGALTGLGFVNIYVAIRQLFGLLRRA